MSRVKTKSELGGAVLVSPPLHFTKAPLLFAPPHKGAPTLHCPFTIAASLTCASPRLWCRFGGVSVAFSRSAIGRWCQPARRLSNSGLLSPKAFHLRHNPRLTEGTQSADKTEPRSTKVCSSTKNQQQPNRDKRRRSVVSGGRHGGKQTREMISKPPDGGKTL